MTVLGRVALVALCASVLVVAGCGGDDEKATGAGEPMGVTSPIDGNATCAGGVTGPNDVVDQVEVSEENGVTTVEVDELTFRIAPFQTPAKLRSGVNEGMYSWKSPASLTSERNAIVELDRDQIKSARLFYDEIDRDQPFDDVASTVRFQACQESDLIGTDQKELGETTGWAGAILTKEPELCLEARVFSERNNESKPVTIPLGRDCD